MKITLNELKYILNKSTSQLLTEISNNAIETIIKQSFYDDRNAIAFMDYTLSDIGEKSWAVAHSFGISDEDIASAPNMKVKDWMRLKIMRDFGVNRDNGPKKYLRGIVRICCSNDIRIFNGLRYNTSARRSYKLFKELISYIVKNGIELSEDLNGMTLGELNKHVGPQMRSELFKVWRETKDKFNSEAKIFGDYTVKMISSYEEASKYSQYTSWCVTHGVNAFENYTGDGSQFFFCLKNGFENMQERQKENCPLDEYGLSMVSVLVYPGGEVKHITTRWNHNYNGEDNPELRTFEQVEQVMGIPKETFVHCLRPKISEIDLPFLLANTDIPLNELCDKVLDMINGMAVVRMNGYVNAINKDRQILGKKWHMRYNVVGDNIVFNQGNTYEIVNSNGSFTKEPFESYRLPQIFDSNSKQIIICKQGYPTKYNIINENGETLLSENFDYISPLIRGYAMVGQGTASNFIDKNHAFIWDEWKTVVIDTKEFWNDGIAIVKCGDKLQTYIDIKTGKYLTHELFTDCQRFFRGYGVVKNEEDKMNVIDKQGKILFDKWFKKIHLVDNDYFAISVEDNKETIFNKQGEKVIEGFYENIYSFNGKYFSISKDNINFSILNTKGEVVLECGKNFPARIFNNDTILVISFNPFGCNILNIVSGKYLFNKFLQSTGTPDGLQLTDDNGNVYLLNTDTGEISKQ